MAPALAALVVLERVLAAAVLVAAEQAMALAVQASAAQSDVVESHQWASVLAAVRAGLAPLPDS